jgi:hypothetical protein
VKEKGEGVMKRGMKKRGMRERGLDTGLTQGLKELVVLAVVE